VGYMSAEDRREQLIEATIAVLRRDGLDAVTTRAIATEAAAPLASIHYTFGSVDDLVVAAYERLIDEVGEQLTDGIDLSAGFGPTVRTVLGRVGALLGDDRFAVLLGDLNPGTDPRVVALEERYYRLAHDLVDAVAERTGREPALSRVQAARLVMAAIDGVVMQFSASGDVTAATADLDAFGEILGRAIEGERPSRSRPKRT
jgi:AcrR family transcriptional regulator